VKLLPEPSPIRVSLSIPDDLRSPT